MKGLNNKQVVKALEAGFEVRESSAIFTEAITKEEADFHGSIRRGDTPFHFQVMQVEGIPQRYFCVALYDVIEVKENGKKFYITNNENDLTIWKYDDRGFYDMVAWLDFCDYKTQGEYFVALTRKLISICL